MKRSCGFVSLEMVWKKESKPHHQLARHSKRPSVRFLKVCCETHWGTSGFCRESAAQRVVVQACHANCADSAMPTLPGVVDGLEERPKIEPLKWEVPANGFTSIEEKLDRLSEQMDECLEVGLG